MTNALKSNNKLISKLTEQLWEEFLDEQTSAALDRLTTWVVDENLKQIKIDADVVASAIERLEMDWKLDNLDKGVKNNLVEMQEKLLEIRKQNLDKLEELIKSQEKAQDAVVYEDWFGGEVSRYADKAESIAKDNPAWFILWSAVVVWAFRSAGEWLFGNEKKKKLWLGGRIKRRWQNLAAWVWARFTMSKIYPTTKAIKNAIQHPVNTIINWVKSLLAGIYTSMWFEIPEWLKHVKSVFVETKDLPEGPNDPIRWLDDEKTEELYEEQEVGSLIDGKWSIILPNWNEEQVFIDGSLEELDELERKKLRLALGESKYYQRMLFSEMNDLWVQTARIAAHQNYSSKDEPGDILSEASRLQSQAEQFRRKIIDWKISASQAKSELQIMIKWQRKRMFDVEHNVEPVFNENDVTSIFDIIDGFKGSTHKEMETKKREIYALAKKEFILWSISSAAAWATDQITNKLTDHELNNNLDYKKLRDFLKNEKNATALLDFMASHDSSGFSLFLSSHVDLPKEICDEVAEDLIQKHEKTRLQHEKGKSSVIKAIRNKFGLNEEPYSEYKVKQFVQSYNLQFWENIRAKDSPFTSQINKLASTKVDEMITISSMLYTKETLLFHHMEKVEATRSMKPWSEEMLASILWVGKRLSNKTRRTCINVGTQIALSLIPMWAWLLAARAAIGAVRAIWLANVISKGSKLWALVNAWGKLAIGGISYHTWVTATENLMLGRDLFEWRSKKENLIMNVGTYGVLGILWPALRGSNMMSKLKNITPGSSVPAKLLQGAIPLSLEAWAFSAVSATARSSDDPTVDFQGARSREEFLTWLVFARMFQSKMIRKTGDKAWEKILKWLSLSKKWWIKLKAKYKKNPSKVSAKSIQKLASKYAKPHQKIDDLMNGKDPFSINGRQYKIKKDKTSSEPVLMKLWSWSSVRVWTKELQELVESWFQKLQANTTNKLYSKLSNNSTTLSSLFEKWLLNKQEFLKWAKTHKIGKIEGMTVWKLFKHLWEWKIGKILFEWLLPGKRSLKGLKNIVTWKPIRWVWRIASDNFWSLSILYWWLVWDEWWDAWAKEAAENYLLYTVIGRWVLWKIILWGLDFYEVL